MDLNAALWVDKHRPASFSTLNLHPKINERLLSLANSEDLPHLLFIGPSGSGKMTRIRALLRELFGNGFSKMKVDERVFQTPSGKKIEVSIFSSNFHVEINPSDVGIYDRVIIQEIIKDLAQTQKIDKSKHVFKIAVILEADRLTKDAQHALRRTMEKYSSNLRLILCCNSSSKIIAPIKSRCLIIRVPSPTDGELESIISSISLAENIPINETLFKSVVGMSKGNLRRAILAFEAAVVKNSSIASNPDWEMCIIQAVDQLFKDQSPNSLLLIRTSFYQLLTHCIPVGIIIEGLISQIIPRLKNINIGHEILEAASFYEHRATKGSKSIIHLEAFIAKSMSIIASG